MFRTLMLIAAALILLAVQAQGIERLSLEVRCELAEVRYRVNLTDAQIEDIEESCASQVAASLGGIRFLDFVAGESRDNQLVVRLGKADADPFDLRPVDLEIFVQGRDVKEDQDPVRWTFRSADTIANVSGPSGFANDIAVVFAMALLNNGDQLVQQQLGTLQIADRAYAIPEQKSWLLPFSGDELGIADESELRIKAALEFSDSEERFTYRVVLIGDFASDDEVPPEFHHKVKALHLGDGLLSVDDSIQRLIDADGIDVLYVVVSRYVPSTAPGRTSPSDLGLGEAGETP